MSDAADVFTSDEESPRSECCDAVMTWIECENCDGEGWLPGSRCFSRPCLSCKTDGGEWTCPRCQK